MTSPTPVVIIITVVFIIAAFIIIDFTVVVVVIAIVVAGTVPAGKLPAEASLQVGAERGRVVGAAETREVDGAAVDLLGG